MYVVVTEGVMVRVPSSATAPNDEIVTLVALDVFHISEPADPCGRLVGLAVSTQVGAFGGGGVTTTVVVQVTVPPGPVATKV